MNWRSLASHNFSVILSFDAGHVALAPIAVRMLVWLRRYKHFGRFDKPKANVLCSLKSPEAYESPRSVVLNQLLAKMVDEGLNEFA